MTIQTKATIHRTTVDTTILAMRTPLTTPLMISTLLTASTQRTRWMILLGWIILTPVLEALITRTTEEGLIRLTMGYGLIMEEAHGVTTVVVGTTVVVVGATVVVVGVTVVVVGTTVVVGATVGGKGLAISLSVITF